MKKMDEEKRLTDEEINELFKEFGKTKDKKIRDLLIREHLYIAEILAKKYTNKGIEFDDLYQVASVGLILAVDRFETERGYKFSSFATPTIIGEIKKYFRDKGWVIRVPRRIQELSKRVNNAKTHLSQTLQKSPSIQDIAEYIDSTEEEVLEAMEASKVYAPQSLDASFESSDDDRDINLTDLIGEEDKKTQVAISKELGISQMTVSRIEKKIIEKFREEMKV